MSDYVYDSGALIAIDSRGNIEELNDHKNRLAQGDLIIVPVPVAAQVVRDPRRQARLMLTLRGCEIVPFEEDDISPVGKLLARSGTSDVVDGFVALTAVKEGAAVVTSDPDDIAHLLGTLGVRLPVLRV
ncbi:MAG TPA: PIN domain-containing protein [Streptosporangiaceae bacterium]